MSRTVSHSEAGFPSRPCRDSAAWVRAADVLAVLVALSLPWSTSLVAIFVVGFILCLLPFFDAKLFAQTIKRPASLAPVALFALAVIGMLWASDISWTTRAQGLGPVAKLLLIPVFFYHFEKSGRGLWVIGAFVASCCVVLALSWFLHFAGFTWSYFPGVPVKNYIAQSQEFAFCIFVLLGVAMFLLEQRRMALAVCLAALAAVFIANFVFVTSSRTVLICAPVLLLIFALKHYGRTGILLTLVAAIVVAAVAWFASPNLRARVSFGVGEVKVYEEKNVATSTGLRLEYWRKSMKFIEQSPIFGHGTGTIRALFEKDAVGQTGASAEVVNNPHNQTLHVAIQWGALGVIVLFALWIAHLKLFAFAPGIAGWIGLVAVVENVVSSLFNSHMFDFTEGWIYVLAVGAAGGMIFGGRDKSAGWSLR